MNERVTERGDPKKKRMTTEDQLRNIVTARTIGGFETVTNSAFGGFENVTKGTFGGFPNRVFEGFENVTSDIIGDNYTTDVMNALENIHLMDVVNTTNIGLLVEARNRTMVEIENTTHVETMDAPAPEFM